MPILWCHTIYFISVGYLYADHSDYRVLRVFLFSPSNINTSIVWGYPYIYVWLSSQIVTHVCNNIICINEFVYFNILWTMRWSPKHFRYFTLFPFDDIDIWCTFSIPLVILLFTFECEHSSHAFESSMLFSLSIVLKSSNWWEYDLNLSSRIVLSFGTYLCEWDWLMSYYYSRYFSWFWWITSLVRHPFIYCNTWSYCVFCFVTDILK